MKAIMNMIVVLVGLSLVSCQHGYKDHKNHEGHKGHHSHEGHEGHGKHKMWEMMDTNKDGAISKEEFDKAHSEKFKKMDANSDGKVTMEEKKAFKKSMMGEKKACCS